MGTGINWSEGEIALTPFPALLPENTYRTL